MKNFTKKFILCMFLILFSLSLVSAVSAETHVIANTKDWRSVYLLTIYGKYTDSDVVFFNSLADAQLKTKMIPVEDELVVFESSVDPVIKNYASLLKINGYDDYTTFSFENYVDLQEHLLNELNPDGYYILDPSYGLDAIASTTFILTNNYFPLFATKDNIDLLSKLTFSKPSYVVGRMPVRILDKLGGNKIQGFPYETLQESTKLSIDSLDTDWGILMRADTVDIDLLVKGLPIFVYHADEYIDELADSVKTSGISKFEVVGAATADIAKAIELQTQKNLNFMLKYGRKITNYPGLENNILDIDSVSFDYPVESLIISKVVHYPELGIIALTFKNVGNSDLLFFSNVEFADEPLSDDNTHAIAVGESKTVPYVLSSKGLSDDTVRVTTRYGSSLPLKFSISGDSGTIFYESKVETNHLASSLYEAELISSGFDTERGLLELVYKNPYDEPIKLFSELLIGDSGVVSSGVTKLGANEKRTVFIETPYIRDGDLLENKFDLLTYVGVDDTLSLSKTSLLIEKKKEFNVWVVVVVIIVILLLSLLVFLFRTKKKNKNNRKKSAKKTTSKKKKTRKR